MNFFILYVALPALFYRIVAQDAVRATQQRAVHAGDHVGDVGAFALSFAVAMAIRRDDMAGSTIAALAGGYGNIGYMGPGLALATLGPAARAGGAYLLLRHHSVLFDRAAADGAGRHAKEERRRDWRST